MWWRWRGAGCGVRGAGHGVERSLLSGLAAFDAGEGNVARAGLPCRGPRFGDAPALRPAGDALLLLLPARWRRVHQAIDLIQRLTGGEVVAREPAYPIVRAAAPIAMPVDAVAWVLSQAVDHECGASRRARPAHPGVSPGARCAWLLSLLPSASLSWLFPDGGRHRAHHPGRGSAHYRRVPAHAARRNPCLRAALLFDTRGTPGMRRA